MSQNIDSRSSGNFFPDRTTRTNPFSPALRRNSGGVIINASLAGEAASTTERGLNDIAVLIFILNRYYSVIFRTIKTRRVPPTTTLACAKEEDSNKPIAKRISHMFNLRGIAGDSPFSIQQEAELMIGHVISHGCLNGTFRRIGITRFHHFNGERNGCCTRRDINIRTLFVILHHIARFVEKGHSDAGCRLISCTVLK